MTFRRLLLGFALLTLTPVAAIAQASDDGLPGFMAGTWMMEDGAAWSDELWSDPKGGLMLGVSRSGFGRALRFWETARIQRKADGSISLFVRPQDGKETEFNQALRSADAVEFTNPAHDFPQRIRYWRQGQLLMAEASLLDGSNAVRWNYRPVVAPAE